MAFEVDPTQTPPFIQELNPPNPNLVKQYISSQPLENRTKAYNELLGFLVPEEDRLYHMNVNDPRNIELLSLAFQRRNNLDLVSNGQRRLPENLTAIVNQLPPEAVDQEDNTELLSYLSPSEQMSFNASIQDEKTETGDKGLQKFLTKQSLLAIAYNRQRQREYETSIEKTQPIKVAPLPAAKEPIVKIVSGPVKIEPSAEVHPQNQEMNGLAAKANWVIKSFFGFGRENNIKAAHELLQQGREAEAQSLVDDIYRRMEANKALPDNITNNLEGFRLNRDFDNILRELHSYRHRQNSAK